MRIMALHASITPTPKIYVSFKVRLSQSAWIELCVMVIKEERECIRSAKMCAVWKSHSHFSHKEKAGKKRKKEDFERDA